MEVQGPGASKTTADLLYDSVYSGAIGGAVVALFFLLIDAMNGQPLFTPSLMGTVLFTNAEAASVTQVHLDMVAYYSIVHLVVFGALGFAISFLVHEVELHARHPGEMLLLLFLVLEGGFFVAATLLMPGVMTVLGPLRVAVANVLAAGAMAAFLIQSHDPELWRRIRRLEIGERRPEPGRD